MKEKGKKRKEKKVESVTKHLKEMITAYQHCCTRKALSE